MARDRPGVIAKPTRGAVLPVTNSEVVLGVADINEYSNLTGVMKNDDDKNESE